MFDMGEPVRIVDLALDLAQLMGISTTDLAVEYTGLRPGEKLKEEVELVSEKAIPSVHEKIRILTSGETLSVRFLQELEELVTLVRQGGLRDQVVQKLTCLVSDYKPWRPGDVFLPPDFGRIKGKPAANLRNAIPGVDLSSTH